ncbi:anti-repressor SinI family protein [Ectobacillus ponti]|uniref:Anti-repressor SinI family protein n=1 Tax=Ectobacillus ponti TaxID=2961894 RepID=A0AA41X7T4_9BACI|nr:anti-repressor SinI family protein [Ectobacillus ponti]MCP8968465.1 anti-repressor SinI family protein [Ectobacillus ponti]
MDMAYKDLDPEWIELMADALDLGLTAEEIRRFLESAPALKSLV